MIASLFVAFVSVCGVTDEVFYARDSQIVLVPPCHTKDGGLVPAMPYAEFLKRSAEFLLDQEQWFKDGPVMDKNGRALPPYFKYAKLRPDGRVYTAPQTDRGVVYPAFHHALGIEAFLQWYVYSGDERALERARQLADWNIAHSTPAEWRYGNLPYSTFVNWAPGGFKDGDALMTDKPAIMGLAYVHLYRTTRDKAYLAAAERIAATLAANQLSAGNWPFRVSPKTGEVREDYTSSVIHGVILFEAVDAVSGKVRYKSNRQRAESWVIENPVKTMDWRGFYEDVAAGRPNRTNWDCIETIRYLVRHRDSIPGAMDMARRLNAWIEETFVERNHCYAPAAGVREQKVCFSIMGCHSMNWGQMMAELYDATGDAAARNEAIQELSFQTYLIQPDNRIAVGPDHGLTHGQGAPYWYSIQFTCLWRFLETLGFVPELAPSGENHVLRSSSVVRAVTYAPESVKYTTDTPSDDVLKLCFEPSRVTVNGKSLRAGDVGWRFDSSSNVLRIHHGGGDVRVEK